MVKNKMKCIIVEPLPSSSVKLCKMCLDLEDIQSDYEGSRVLIKIEAFSFLLSDEEEKKSLEKYERRRSSRTQSSSPRSYRSNDVSLEVLPTSSMRHRQHSGSFLVYGGVFDMDKSSSRFTVVGKKVVCISQFDNFVGSIGTFRTIDPVNCSEADIRYRIEMPNFVVIEAKNCIEVESTDVTPAVCVSAYVRDGIVAQRLLRNVHCDQNILILETVKEENSFAKPSHLGELLEQQCLLLGVNHVSRVSSEITNTSGALSGISKATKFTICNKPWNKRKWFYDIIINTNGDVSGGCFNKYRYLLKTKFQSRENSSRFVDVLEGSLLNKPRYTKGYRIWNKIASRRRECNRSIDFDDVACARELFKLIDEKMIVFPADVVQEFKLCSEQDFSSSLKLASNKTIEHQECLVDENTPTFAEERKLTAKSSGHQSPLSNILVIDDSPILENHIYYSPSSDILGRVVEVDDACVSAVSSVSFDHDMDQRSDHTPEFDELLDLDDSPTDFRESALDDEKFLNFTICSSYKRPLFLPFDDYQRMFPKHSLSPSKSFGTFEKLSACRRRDKTLSEETPILEQHDEADQLSNSRISSLTSQTRSRSFHEIVHLLSPGG